MDEIIAIPMAQRQPSIRKAAQNDGKRLFSFIRSRVKNDEDARILRKIEFVLKILAPRFVYF